VIPPDVERMYAKRMKATTEGVAGSPSPSFLTPTRPHIIAEAATGAAK
jgi:hypothetical protein